MGFDRNRRGGARGRLARVERIQVTTAEGPAGVVRARVRPTVADAPSRREAESDLSERQRRREELEITPLEPESRDRYAEEWRRAQERFVDDPPAAVGDADRLIQDVMRERGYPVSDFDQRAADVSVDHPEVVSNYRAAHGISIANERGKATTEDLRTAMVHYRALFVELLEQEEPAETTA